jgi:hypothetical protein
VFAEVTYGVLRFAWISMYNFGGFILWLLIYGFASGTATTLPAGVGFLVSTPIASAIISTTSGFLGGPVWTGACYLVAKPVGSRHRYGGEEEKVGV